MAWFQDLMDWVSVGFWLFLDGVVWTWNTVTNLLKIVWGVIAGVVRSVWRGLVSLWTTLGWFGNLCWTCILAGIKRAILFISDYQRKASGFVAIVMCAIGCYDGTNELILYMSPNCVNVRWLSCIGTFFGCGVLAIFYPLAGKWARYIESVSKKKQLLHGVMWGYPPLFIAGFVHLFVSVLVLGFTSVCGNKMSYTFSNEKITLLLAMANLLMSFAWSSSDEIGLSSSIVSILVGSMVIDGLRKLSELTFQRLLFIIGMMSAPFLRYILSPAGLFLFAWASPAKPPTKLKRSRSLTHVRTPWVDPEVSDMFTLHHELVLRNGRVELANEHAVIDVGEIMEENIDNGVGLKPNMEYDAGLHDPLLH